MKKLLVFALVLVIAGAAAFAIDLGNGLEIDGQIMTGVKVETPVDPSGDTKVSLEHSDATHSNQYHPFVGFRYTADWGGARVRFDVNHTTVLLSPLDGSVYPVTIMPIAYGWVNLLESKIVISAGTIAEAIWGLGELSSNVFDPDFDGVKGVRVAFNDLVDGLSFGCALPVPIPGGLDISPVMEPTSPIAIGDMFGSAVFGAKYISSVFSAVAALDLVPEAETGNDPYVDAIIGIEVPLAPVSVIVDARIDTQKDDGYVRIGPRIGFSSGQLSAFGFGDINIYNDDNKDPTIGARLGAAYEVLKGVSPFLWVGSNDVADFEVSGLYARAGVNLGLGNCSIGIFDHFDGLGGKKTTNRFQIDFKWTF
jgi:hypothetical protein